MSRERSEGAEDACLSHHNYTMPDAGLRIWAHVHVSRAGRVEFTIGIESMNYRAK